MTLTSPCTGICKLDDRTGWCLGCGRDGAEIADWRTRTDADRQAVWEEIPVRLRALGVACRRLPWTTEEIRSFVASSVEDRLGTWVMGVVGAVGEFVAAPGASAQVTHHGDILDARTLNGAMRMVINEDVRALTFDPDDQTTPPRVVLAVKRERKRAPVSDRVARLSEDTPQLTGAASETLFDLGLGRKEARCCVRVGDGAAKRALLCAEGQPFQTALAKLAPALLAESPARVIDTALGRMEVQGQIPPPTARSPDGPHTHLLPDHLAMMRAMPVGMDVPRAYLPGAIFYPAPGSTD